MAEKSCILWDAYGLISRFPATCLFAMHADKRVENVVWGLIISILLYTTWVWAGIRPSFHKYAFWLSGLLLLLLALLPVSLAQRGQRWLVFKQSLGSFFFKEPLFYLGGLFLVYLAVQWWNSGRELVLDQEAGKWVYSAPPLKDWPSSFKREEAFQIITWFFPAWVIGLSLRSSLLSGRSLYRLLLTIVYSSGLLSLFGIVQFAAHTREIYWTTPLPCDFFASFGYSNHAAAYFLLTGALTTGLLFAEIFRTEGRADRMRVPLLSMCLILDLVGSNLSLSRAGVMLAWAFVIFAVAYGLYSAWKSLTPANRINLFAAMAGVAGVLYFVVAGFGGDAIRNEFLDPFKKITTDQTLFEQADTISGGRSELDIAGYEIWRDNRLFGTGAWGFKYLLALYIPPEKWGLVDTGKANVHCDPLQFVSEFGVVGAGLLSLGVLWLVVELVRNLRRRNYLLMLSAAGLAMVMVMSLIDLPFRCPAIMYTWLTVLIVVPRLGRDK